jgi:hypothetical protein
MTEGERFNIIAHAFNLTLFINTTIPWLRVTDNVMKIIKEESVLISRVSQH